MQRGRINTKRTRGRGKLRSAKSELGQGLLCLVVDKLRLGHSLTHGRGRRAALSACRTTRIGRGIAYIPPVTVIIIASA
jgi:hypothetical protein